MDKIRNVPVADFASFLMAWPDLLTYDECKARLPADLAEDAFFRWVVEAKIIVGSGVIHGCRIGLEQGSRNDTLQQALYERFVEDISDENAAESIMHRVADRTATYRLNFDEWETGKRNSLSVANSLGNELTKFATGKDMLYLGDLADHVVWCGLLGAESPTALDLEGYKGQHLGLVAPLVALHAFARAIAATRE